MPERKTENLKGAMLMVLSMAAFTTNDLFVKLLGAQLPLSQILMLRGAVALLMIAGLCQFYRAWTIRYARKDWGLIALRCAADVCATYFFLNALINMPIANATAILQLLPLTVALGAALFLHELLGWRRMIAIGIGFLGMLMIVRPGAEGFSNYSYYALIAVLFITLRELVTRSMSAHIPSLMITFFAALSVFIYASISMLYIEWVPVERMQAWYLVACSLLICAAYFFSVLAARVGELSFVAPFRYTGLLWALLFGFLVYGDWPTHLALAGAGLVVAAGLYTMWREAKTKEQRGTAPLKRRRK
ncbi:MAG: DMT family transporter [Paracoccaceae bacterium]